jgi:hypothetical protein
VIARHPKLAAVSSTAHQLWIAMWSRADDTAVFRGDPLRLSRRVLRVADRQSVADMLRQLERAELIQPCGRHEWTGIHLRGLNDNPTEPERR